MAPTARVPREMWVRQGLRVLADGGPDAVRVEPLARALGVTRGSFYWHFADRRALLDAMLDAWERSTTEDVIGLLESEGGDAAVKLRRLLAMASPRVLMTDLAVRDWARRDQAVAERLACVDNRRMDFFRSLFHGLPGGQAGQGDPEARSMLAFSLIVGNHFIAASHGDLSRAEVLERALMQLVTASAAHP